MYSEFKHRNVLATLFFSGETLAEEGVRFVKHRYGRRPLTAELLFLDNKNRYLVVDVKTSRPGGRPKTPSQIKLAQQRQKCEQFFGTDKVEKQFRFVLVTDLAMSPKTNSALRAGNIEFKVIPEEILDQEPESKVIGAPASPEDLSRIDPPLTYSFEDAFSKWRFGSNAMDKFRAISNLVDEVLPEFRLTPEIAEKGKSVVPDQARINLANPFNRWPRVGQIDFTRGEIKLKVDSIANVYSGETINESRVRMYDEILPPLKWPGYGSKPVWTHLWSLHGTRSLSRLEAAFRELRKDLDRVWYQGQTSETSR